MGIADHILKIKKQLGENVCLVAVSKTKTIQEIKEAYEAGQRVFGENKVQELSEKYEYLPRDIEWHFIGHLQTNKVKYIAPFISLIHSVDSFKLLKTIDREGKKNNRKIKCLLQFYIAEEETKFGFDLPEAVNVLSSSEFSELEWIEICGVMGMATNTNDEAQIRKEFKVLKNIFMQIKGQFFDKQDSFSEISMGMSGDYQIAVKEGSTMVRIGSLIFGERNS
ncbi:MAG: YggS family pyridoxal phosphate-dependent enzyme [Mangrovibacterium sp.]